MRSPPAPGLAQPHGQEVSGHLLLPEDAVWDELHFGAAPVPPAGNAFSSLSYFCPQSRSIKRERGFLFPTPNTFFILFPPSSHGRLGRAPARRPTEPPPSPHCRCSPLPQPHTTPMVPPNSLQSKGQGLLKTGGRESHCTRACVHTQENTARAKGKTLKASLGRRSGSCNPRVCRAATGGRPRGDNCSRLNCL